MNNKIGASNKLNIHRKFSIKCIALLMLFAMLLNIVCPLTTSLAADGTKDITITVKWNDANSTSLRPSNVTLHLLNKTTNTETVSDNNNWTKNGDTWTYVFTVPDNTDAYEVWEDDITYYSSTATNAHHFSIINDLTNYPDISNKATITNKNTSAAITITKVWENDSPSNRPEDITVYLTKTSTTLLPGTTLCAKMKTIANNGSSVSYTNIYSPVQKIIKATPEQYEAKRSSLTSANEIQNTGENIKVYMWYDSSTKTLLFYSDADNIYMNPDSHCAFYNFRNLSDISGLQYFNTSYVTNMRGMFNRATSLRYLTGLENWNVSNVEDMAFMFSGYNVRDSYDNSNGNPERMKIASIEPLRKWDVSNVTNMSNMFSANTENNNFTDVSPLEDWNVARVTSFYQAFNHSKVAKYNFNKLINWDVTRVVHTAADSSSKFYMMFGWSPGTDNSNYFPRFIKRYGTWDSTGQKYTTSILLTAADAEVTNPPVHAYTSPDADSMTTEPGNWVKNSNNTWTYTFIVNNDGSKYKTWEDATTIPSNYESSANNTTEHPAIYVENNQATITNTNTIRYITITKQWNDNGNTAARPENITLHLTKDGVTDAYVSDNNNWTKEGNTWTYVFEVTDQDNYSVWESNVDGYSTNAPQTSPISITDNSATIINNIITYDITLIKKVTGDMAKLDDEFEVTIALYDRNDNLLNGDILIEKNGTPMQVANGSTLTWVHNDQIVIKDVVTGYKYSIDETDTEYLEHFKIEKTDDLTELVSLDVGRTISNRVLNQNETVTFINNKEAIPLTMAGTYTNPFVIIAVLSIICVIAIKNKKFIDEFIDKHI